MKKLILTIIFVCVCSHSFAVFSTAKGEGYMSADDYYRTHISRTNKMNSGFRYTTMGDDEDDKPGDHRGEFLIDDEDDKPGSHRGEVLFDNEDHKPNPREDGPVNNPIGPLPFAFFALLAGGYLVLKRRQTE